MDVGVLGGGWATALSIRLVLDAGEDCFDPAISGKDAVAPDFFEVGEWLFFDDLFDRVFSTLSFAKFNSEFHNS